MGSPSFAILVFSKNREFFNIFSPKYTAADTFQQKKGLLLNFRFATAPYKSFSTVLHYSQIMYKEFGIPHN